MFLLDVISPWEDFTRTTRALINPTTAIVAAAAVALVIIAIIILKKK